MLVSLGGTTRGMFRVPFPSTIEVQPRNVTFLTIKTIVRKIQKTTVLGQGSAWTKGGGGLAYMALHRECVFVIK